MGDDELNTKISGPTNARHCNYIAEEIDVSDKGDDADFFDSVIYKLSSWSDFHDFSEKEDFVAITVLLRAGVGKKNVLYRLAGDVWIFELLRWLANELNDINWMHRRRKNVFYFKGADESADTYGSFLVNGVLRFQVRVPVQSVSALHCKKHSPFGRKNVLACGLSYPSWSLGLLASLSVLLLFHSVVYMEYVVDSLLHFFFFLHSDDVLAEHFLYSRERFLSAFSRLSL